MYTLMQTNYQFHIPTETDRAWLAETMTAGLFTPDNAIDYGIWDGSSESVTYPLRFSRIISRVSDNQRIAWALSKIVESTTCMHAFAVHPDFRGQRLARGIVEESAHWFFSDSCPLDIENITTVTDNNLVPSNLSPSHYTVVETSGNNTVTSVTKEADEAARP